MSISTYRLSRVNREAGLDGQDELVVLCPLQPVDETLQPRMLFVMHMHEHEAESCGVRPAHFGHFNRERFVGGREIDLEGETCASRKRLLTDHMTPFPGKTGDQPAPGNRIA